MTGKMIEIPYLTVNIADYGLDENKYNLRFGFLMKLVSTYSNGNVYGAATVILLPLFDQIESKKAFRALVRVALFLTLSRTAWFALIFDMLLTSWPALRKTVLDLPVVVPRKLRKLFSRSGYLRNCCVFGCDVDCNDR